MKILVICVFPPVALPEADHAFHLVQHLADAGAAVDVLTAKGSVEASHSSVTQLSIMEKWDWSEAGRLALSIKRSRPDAVLLYYLNNLYHQHPMITFVPTMVRTLLPNTPIVTLFTNTQATSPGKFGLASRIIYKAARVSSRMNVDYSLGTMLRDSSRIITMSRHHLQELVSLLPSVSQKSAIIPPPPILPLSADTQETRLLGREQLGVSDDMFLFAYFGYLYPGKGLETLVRAFSVVADGNSRVRLAIIGSVLQFIGGAEYAEKVQQLVNDLGIADKVIFTGAFDWDSTQGSVYLRAADACVLPFTAGVQMNNSSFAAVVTHGLPVVTTAGFSLEEPFIDGENVSLCPPENPEAMAAAMRKVMNDSQFRDSLHQGALRFADEWFSWTRHTQRTLAALELSPLQEKLC